MSAAKLLEFEADMCGSSGISKAMGQKGPTFYLFSRCPILAQLHWHPLDPPLKVEVWPADVEPVLTFFGPMTRFGKACLMRAVNS